MNMFQNVMVVDDTQLDRFIAEKVLTKTGVAASVVAMIDAAQALDFLEQNPETIPEIILVDINMPKMNGLEFLEKFASLSQRVRATCKIIMLTSSIDAGDKIRAMKYPWVLGFLTKPVNIEQFKELVGISTPN